MRWNYLSIPKLQQCNLPLSSLKYIVIATHVGIRNTQSFNGWLLQVFHLLWSYFNGLVQERRNSIANALELCLSCTNPLIYQSVMPPCWCHNSRNRHDFTTPGPPSLFRVWSQLLVLYADTAKTFGLLPDRRTGKHVENSGFTGPPTVLQALIFLTLDSL